jgi:hypothetical protein
MDFVSYKSASSVLLKLLSALGLCVTVNVQAQSINRGLSAYYDAWGLDGPTSIRPWQETIPRVRITGGGLEPTIEVALSGFGVQSVPIAPPYPVYDLVNLFDVSDSEIRIYAYREGACDGWVSVSRTAEAGAKSTNAANVWTKDLAPTTDRSRAGRCAGFQPQPGNVPQLRTTDEITYGAPVRRTAIDGSQYDASPMVLRRNGLPWYTHYFGYHLGLIANESNWDTANLSRAGDLAGFFTFPSPVNNFNLAKLPPPWVEDDVLEYVNRAEFPNQPGGQFFYTALPNEKTLLDSVPTWQRTGKRFKSGGYVSACRFYGGKNGGPNTHFYSKSRFWNTKGKASQ